MNKYKLENAEMLGAFVHENLCKQYITCSECPLSIPMGQFFNRCASVFVSTKLKDIAPGKFLYISE